MTSSKKYSIEMRPCKKETGNFTSEELYKVDIALKPGLISEFNFTSKFTDPFVTASIINGDYICTAWIGAIVGSFVKVHAAGLIVEQMTATLLIRVCDGALAEVFPKRS